MQPPWTDHAQRAFQWLPDVAEGQRLETKERRLPAMIPSICSSAAANISLASDIILCSMTLKTQDPVSEKRRRGGVMFEERESRLLLLQSAARHISCHRTVTSSAGKPAVRDNGTILPGVSGPSGQASQTPRTQLNVPVIAEFKHSSHGDDLPAPTGLKTEVFGQKAPPALTWTVTVCSEGSRLGGLQAYFISSLWGSQCQNVGI